MQAVPVIHRNGRSLAWRTALECAGPSSPRGHWIELIPQRNLNPLGRVHRLLVQRIDHAIHIRQIRIATFAGDRVVDQPRADDRFIEIGGVAGALQFVIVELLIVCGVAGLGLGRLLFIDVLAAFGSFAGSCRTGPGTASAGRRSSAGRPRSSADCAARQSAPPSVDRPFPI